MKTIQEFYLSLIFSCLLITSLQLNQPMKIQQYQMALNAWTYLQLPLRQWGAGNVYLLVLSSWKVNIAENPIAIMGL